MPEWCTAGNQTQSLAPNHPTLFQLSYIIYIDFLLTGMIVKAYGKDFMCPVKQLTENLHVLEMFHGKTKAFKDISLTLLAQFLEFFLDKQNKHSTILVGTSGDTGSAAIESVRNLKHIDIIVLFPKGYCSKVQELQMTTVLDKNVHVYCVEGSSDDLDVPLKQCTLNKEFVDRYNIGSMNSINIGRILAQIVYYFYVYLKCCKKVGEKVKIVVPTGAMGNITGKKKIFSAFELILIIKCNLYNHF